METIYVVKNHDYDICEIIGIYSYKHVAEFVARTYGAEVEEWLLDQHVNTALNTSEGPLLPYAFYSFWIGPDYTDKHRNKECLRLKLCEVPNGVTKIPIVRDMSGGHREAIVWARSEAEAHDLLYAALERELL
jgi:hypothetical protein